MMLQRSRLVRLCAQVVSRHRQSLHNSTRCVSAESSSSSSSSSSTQASQQTCSSTERPATEGSNQQSTTTEVSSSNEASAGPEADAPPQEDFIPLKKNPFWTTFKALLAGSFAAGTIASAYATYAYSTEEVEKKVSALWSSAEVKLKKPESLTQGGALQASADFYQTDQESLLQKVKSVVYSNSFKAAAGVAGLYLDVRKSIEGQVKGFAAPTSDKLLPDLLPQERHVFTLVLDLNETLVYSDWTRDRGWRTFKRPGAEAFLEHLAQFYELIIYTDQLPFTVDPILEKLDQKGCIRYRLAREATQYINGKHYKDLSKLNRDPAHVMFLSAHAKETCLQPENAVPVKAWKLESDDTKLLDMLPFLEYVARYRPADVRPVLASYDGHDIPSEFLVRTKDYQKKMRELKSQNPFFRSSRSS